MKILYLIDNFFKEVRRRYQKYLEKQRIEARKNERIFRELIDAAKKDEDFKELADLYSMFKSPEDRRRAIRVLSAFFQTESTTKHETEIK